MPSEEGWSLLAAAKLRLIPWTRLIPWAGLLLWGCQTEDTRIDPPQVRVGIRTSVSTETTRQDSLADGKDTSSPPKLEVAASTGVQLASAGETVSPVKKAAFESPRRCGLVASSADLPLQMTLDQAISTSLDRNPTLVALRATDPIARAVLHVAETYPFNPYVQLEVLPYARTSWVSGCCHELCSADANPRTGTSTTPPRGQRGGLARTSSLEHCVGRVVEFLDDGAALFHGPLSTRTARSRATQRGTE